MANRRGANEYSSSSSSSIDDDAKDTKNPDVSSVDQSRENNSRIAEEPPTSAGADLPRREENPFSFKHFLSKDARSNYTSAGARPKMYCPMRKSVEKSQNAGPETDGVYSRNPTELPDFVQDHLVIEQCYLNDDTVSSTAESGIADAAAIAGAHPLLADIDNLPDFTLTGMDQRPSPSANSRVHRRAEQSQCRKAEKSALPPADLPFDLTGGLERRKREKSHGTLGKMSFGSSEAASFGNRPNHLPIRRVDSLGRISDAEGLPFDLPAATLEPRLSGDKSRASGPSNSPANEASVNKSLPDFLNDGPIRNRVGAPSTVESTSSSDKFASEDASLLLENERLRDELMIARRQIADGTRMIESLKAELTSRRRVDSEETAHLEKAMEQVEANLKQSTKRATIAENTASLLKQQVKTLTTEVTILRAENQQLAGLTGAGCAADYRTPSTERRIKKLSDELRAAATSAEASLRQLMSGVNNLKVLASAIENVDRIEDRTKDFLPDFEEDNAAGPAL